jgi:hypothetical protein
MSLRCRYAPAYGSEVVSFRAVYPALIPQCGFSSKSIAPRERDGARTVSRLWRFVHVSAPAFKLVLKASIGLAFGALCISRTRALILALRYAIKHKILRPYPDAEENASGYTGLRMTFFARDMCFSFLNACFFVS